MRIKIKINKKNLNVGIFIEWTIKVRCKMSYEVFKI